MKLDGKWVIFGVALVILASVGGGWVVYSLVADHLPSAQPRGQAMATESIGQPWDLGDFTVNLADPAGRHFARLKITLEAMNPEVVTELDQRKAQLRDLVISIVGVKRLEDVATDQGREMLRSQLLNSVNRLLLKGRVKAVYFTDFVYQ